MSGYCPDCGDPICDDDDSHKCAGCEGVFCGDCIEWHAPEYDPPRGDYFCFECQDEGEEE